MTVTDYQYAYFNKLIYGAEEPEGPVEHFSIFKESGPQESGLAALAFISSEVRPIAKSQISYPKLPCSRGDTNAAQSLLCSPWWRPSLR